MIKWILLLGLFLPASAAAQVTACAVGTAPTISNQTYVYSDIQTLTVTWDTSCGSTSTVAVPSGAGDSGIYAASYKLYQDQTYPGTTSHSLTLTPSTGFFQTTTNYAGITAISCGWTATNAIDMTKCSFTCWVPQPPNSPPCINSSSYAPNPSAIANTLAYQAGPNESVRLGAPKQDGVHPGYVSTPGKNAQIIVGFNATVVPFLGFQFSNQSNSTTFSGALLTDFGITSGVWSSGGTQTPWTGGPSPSCANGGGNLYTNMGCALSFTLPSTVPTGANPTACTSHINTDGTPAVVIGTSCVFPIDMSFHVNTCGSATGSSPVYTCTDAPNQRVWIWVDSEAFPFNIGAAGVHRPPCLTDADIATDPQKTNCTTDVNYNPWHAPHSWIGTIQNNFGAWWLLQNRTDSNAQFIWFYDGCYMAVKFAQYIGQNDPWLGYNQTCMHNYRDHTIYPVQIENATVFTFTQAVNATILYNTNNPTGINYCNQLTTTGYAIRCANMSVPVPATTDLTAFCAGFNTNGFTYQASVSTVTGLSTGGNQGHIKSCTPTGTTGGTIVVESPVSNSATNGWTYAPVGSVWTFTRELNNIPAEATTTGQSTDTTHIYCGSCDFTNILTNGNSVCYAGTIQGTNGVNFGNSFFSINPNPGAVVAASDVANHVITLNRAIAVLAPGVPFQCRRYAGPPSPPQIYYWGESFYDLWQRYGDYTSADIIPRYVSTYPNVGSPGNTNGIREQGLWFNNCRLNADLVAAGVSTATTYPLCSPGTSYFSVQLDNILQMTETIARNSRTPAVMAPPNCFTDPVHCDDKGLDAFLMGVRIKALIHCYEDMNCSGYNDVRIPWNIRDEISRFWNVWYSPNTGIAATYPSYCHQSPYIPQTAAIGNPSYGSSFYNSTLARYCAPYFTLFHMVMAADAWMYYLTGNGTIPGSNPPYTYAQAFDDFWQFSIPNSWANWNFLPKTMGEQNGLNWEAIEIWFGNGTLAAPATLTISSTALPNGSVGAAYTGYLSAAGGTPPYHWTAMGLPAGLTLSGSTISGTPTTSFAGQVSVTVTDSATTPAMATASLPLTITAPVITTGLPSFAYPIP